MPIARTVSYLAALLPGLALASGNMHVSGSYVSDAPDGMPPLVVNSTDLVANLNADMLDGMDSAEYVLKSELSGGDGALEINQDCALNTGCFDGDSAGFPVTISGSILPTSSFRLTSNLDVSGETVPEDVTAIHVFASPGVAIDLNGLTIIGPNTCTGTDGAALSCTHLASGLLNGLGIRGDSGMTVRNGFIRGMGGRGIFCNANCRLLDLHVQFSGREGAAIGSNAQVQRVRFFRNADGGLLAADGAAVVSVAAEDNAGYGVSVSRSGVVKDVTAMENGSHGIIAGAATVITDSTARSNFGNGIEASGSLLRSNTALTNQGHGINMNSTAVAQSNASWSNAGIELNGGNQMGDNWCDNALCP